MREAIGQVLPFGVGMTLSPIPITGVVLMLGTPRARSNGLAFIAGWVLGLPVVAQSCCWSRAAPSLPISGSRLTGSANSTWCSAHCSRWSR